MYHRSLSTLLGITAVLACAPSSYAVTRTFTMAGTVTSIYSEGPVEPPVGHLGDRVVYTFTFDSDVQPTGSTETVARYPTISAFLRIGSQSVTCPAPSMFIAHPMDTFEVSSDLPPPAGAINASLFFRLSDQADNNSLTGHSLPAAPYGLDSWDSKYFSISFLLPPLQGDYHARLVGLDGPIDTFTPEPAGAVLFVLGSVLALRRRRA